MEEGRREIKILCGKERGKIPEEAKENRELLFVALADTDVDLAKEPPRGRTLVNQRRLLLLSHPCPSGAAAPSGS